MIFDVILLTTYESISTVNVIRYYLKIIYGLSYVYLLSLLNIVRAVIKIIKIILNIFQYIYMYYIFHDICNTTRFS